MSDDKICKMIEMARAHVETGGMNSAGAYYRIILKETNPPKTGIECLAHGEACMWYARKAAGAKCLGEAMDWYQKAIHADPRAVDYRLEYCIKSLRTMGMFKNGRIEAERATKIEPDNPSAWSVLGGMEHALGNVKEAIAAYDRQIELAPDDPNAKWDRATLALDLADYPKVREMVRGMASSDRRGDALHMLAMVSYREGNHKQAIRLYEQAEKEETSDPDLVTWNKSLAMQSIGQYKEGWKASEARGRQRTDSAMRLIMNRFTIPMWRGPTLDPAPGRLHVHQEMGHGDIIAMARYLPILVELGYDVRMEVNDSLVGLMQRSFPSVKVMPRAIDYPGSMGVEPFDWHVPMLSLPALFDIDIDTVPWSGPYLKPNPELVKKYDQELSARPHMGRDHPRVGLCWSSGIRHEGLWLKEYGMRKSIGIKNVAPLMEAPFTYVSLQVGPERDDWKRVTYFSHQIYPNEPYRVMDVLPPEPTWDDTAALVESLDLVITVDTSVAHLAGALGKPVWVFMHTEGSWHWMVERRDSPWYPSARLFRQERPHEWGKVAHDVKNALVRQEYHLEGEQCLRATAQDR